MLRRHTERSRMSVRNITEMNIKNKKSRDRRFLSSATIPRPLLETQPLQKPKPNFCLEITKRPQSQHSEPIMFVSPASTSIVSGFKPKLKPKLLYDNPFILGNIIKKKLKVLAGGDIDQYLESLASESIKKRVTNKKPQLRFTAEV